ncbi:MAG: TerB family tellurite resistance protein [Deltaproteobacteria bacterium]|nr:TerB family tellurite resistance protein [Deltaproteobacteria bacterium]
MRDHEEAILKSLVAVAWADGRMEGEEKEVLEALISAFELGSEDAQSVRDFAASPKSLSDIPVDKLEEPDRRLLLQHAVILSYIDGTQSDREKVMLDELVTKLAIPRSEADGLLEAADQRAKRLLDLL